MARSKFGRLCVYMGETVRKILKGSSTANDQDLCGYRIDSSGSWAMYMYVYKHFNTPPFTETAWSIEAEINVEPPLEGGAQLFVNGIGNMTKIATIPKYGKHLKQSSFSECLNLK